MKRLWESLFQIVIKHIKFAQKITLFRKIKFYVFAVNKEILVWLNEKVFYTENMLQLE